MARSITIEIPTLIPRALTPNRSREMHWGTFTKEKTRVQQLVFVMANEAKQRYFIDNGKQWEPLEAAIIFYEFVIKNLHYVMDDDNVLGGCKFIRDVLQIETKGKTQGVGIYRDDRAVVNGRVTWAVNKQKAPLTIITVQEIREGGLKCQ